MRKRHRKWDEKMGLATSNWGASFDGENKNRKWGWEGGDGIAIADSSRNWKWSCAHAMLNTSKPRTRKIRLQECIERGRERVRRARTRGRRNTARILIQV